MSGLINVIKRNSEKEILDIEKIHKVLTWACEDITGVSVSEIAIKSQIQFYNNIKTETIHETLIKSAADLITEDSPNYQYVAGRLVNYQIRKQVFDNYNPHNLYDHYIKIKNIGYYDELLEELYTLEEWEELNNYIKHDRDYDLTFAAMEQFRSKYLVKNRITGEIFETPQIAYMLMSMKLFSIETENRLKWVKDCYDALSTFDISLPTPIMAGVRTPKKQFASCFIIESDDNLDSINATASAIVKYVANRAGVGVHGGKIRGFKSPIRGGDAYHTGVIPFWKHFDSAVNSCSQGGVRKGSATCNVQWWHYEIEDLIVLKNNKGTPETRIPTMDYCIQFNKLFYERVLAGENISLFSPSEVPGLYDAFYEDPDKFKELYEKYERSRVRKKTIPAIDLFNSFVQERLDTGRIYLMNVDHVNSHGAYDPRQAPVRALNLCVEICENTEPLQSLDDPTGRIALCILAAGNWGKIKKPEDFAKPCEILVRLLDNLIDLQEYLLPASENYVRDYRSLGIGIINFAYFLAKNDKKYTSPDLNFVHEYTEAWAYYITKASVDLAKERGPCRAIDKTLYGKGILPIDTYKHDVNTLVAPVYKQDWEALRKDLIQYGIRNAPIMAIAPTETSSLISNATNGIEPPRALVTKKSSNDGEFAQVVPGIQKLKNKYELLWDQESPIGYLQMMAVIQKFVDQSISTNTSYNPKFYPDEMLPISEVQKHILLAYKWGIKSLYYNNVYDGATDSSDEEICESCAI